MAKPPIEIYSNGPVYCSICTSLKDAGEIEAMVNMLNPAKGLTWAIVDEDFRTGESNPCECDEDPGRMHYLLAC